MMEIELFVCRRSKDGYLGELDSFLDGIGCYIDDCEVFTVLAHDIELAVQIDGPRRLL